MSELLQAEVEALALRALYDLANQGSSWVDAAYIAGVLQTGISQTRAQLALRVLDASKLVRARHNVNSGSKYEISEQGYKQVEADNLAAQQIQIGDLAGAVAPAADRIVGYDHNSREFKETREKVSELGKQLAQANDLGELSLRAAQVAAVEVEAIGNTMDQDFFRPAELWTRANMTLRWIGRESAGAVVGAAALALLTLLAAFLGFPVI